MPRRNYKYSSSLASQQETLKSEKKIKRKAGKHGRKVAYLNKAQVHSAERTQLAGIGHRISRINGFVSDGKIRKRTARGDGKTRKRTVTRDGRTRKDTQSVFDHGSKRSSEEMQKKARQNLRKKHGNRKHSYVGNQNHTRKERVFVPARNDLKHLGMDIHPANMMNKCVIDKDNRKHRDSKVPSFNLRPKFALKHVTKKPMSVRLKSLRSSSSSRNQPSKCHRSDLTVSRGSTASPEYLISFHANGSLKRIAKVQPNHQTTRRSGSNKPKRKKHQNRTSKRCSLRNKETGFPSLHAQRKLSLTTTAGQIESYLHNDDVPITSKVKLDTNENGDLLQKRHLTTGRVGHRSSSHKRAEENPKQNYHRHSHGKLQDSCTRFRIRNCSGDTGRGTRAVEAAVGNPNTNVYRWTSGTLARENCDDGLLVRTLSCGDRISLENLTQIEYRRSMKELSSVISRNESTETTIYRNESETTNSLTRRKSVSLEDLIQGDRLRPMELLSSSISRNEFTGTTNSQSCTFSSDESSEVYKKNSWEEEYSSENMLTDIESENSSTSTTSVGLVRPQTSVSSLGNELCVSRLGSWGKPNWWSTLASVELMRQHSQESESEADQMDKEFMAALASYFENPGISEGYERSSASLNKGAENDDDAISVSISSLSGPCNKHCNQPMSVSVDTPDTYPVVFKDLVNESRYF